MVSPRLQFMSQPIIRITHLSRGYKGVVQKFQDIRLTQDLIAGDSWEALVLSQHRVVVHLMEQVSNILTYSILQDLRFHFAKVSGAQKVQNVKPF